MTQPIQFVDEGAVEAVVEEVVVDASADGAVPEISAAGPAVISHDEDDAIEAGDEPAVAAPPPRPRVSGASDPLAPFMALSAEEKIALFT
jgi:hypothetical protein